MYKNKAIGTALIFLVFLIFFANLLYAGSIPQLINYNGHLANSAGAAVPDGEYEVEFNIYDSSTGGTSLWTEKWDSSTSKVVTHNGTFNALLGTHTTIPADFFNEHPATYLGVKVGTDTEMLPRQRLASVAYSFTAGTSGVPKGAIIMWSGAIDDIPEGWALCDGNNETPNLTDKFIVGAGSTYNPKDTGGSDTINISSHTHSITSDSPTTNTAGSHTHTVSGSTTGDPSGFNSSPRLRKNSDENYMGHSHNITGTAASGGEHSHTVNSHNHQGNTGSSGETSVDNKPPYFALAFIMKL